MGTAVAAVMLRREREIVEDFRAAGATAPERAQLLDPHGVGSTLAAQRLKRRAVLREAAPGAWWLDEPSWEALRGMRRRLAVLLLVVVAVLALAGVFGSRAVTHAAAPAPAPASSAPAAPASPAAAAPPVAPAPPAAPAP